MTKKFTINCDFGGQMAPFGVFVGTPALQHHPLQHQSKWLGDQRGGMIPSDVMDALAQLYELSQKNGVLLEELCVYALNPNVNDKREVSADEESTDNDNDQAGAPTDDEESTDNDNDQAEAPTDDEESTDNSEIIDIEKLIEDIEADEIAKTEAEDSSGNTQEQKIVDEQDKVEIKSKGIISSENTGSENIDVAKSKKNDQ